MTTRLETERLTLRPWAEADAPALFRAASDPEVGPRAGWDPHRNVEESARIIREVLAVPETYAIVIRGAVPADEPVGAVGLKFGAASDLARDASEAELGYWIARPQWGGGATSPRHVARFSTTPSTTCASRSCGRAITMRTHRVGA